MISPDYHLEPQIRFSKTSLNQMASATRQSQPAAHLSLCCPPAFAVQLVYNKTDDPDGNGNAPWRRGADAEWVSSEYIGSDKRICFLWAMAAHCPRAKTGSLSWSMLADSTQEPPA